MTQPPTSLAAPINSPRREGAIGFGSRDGLFSLLIKNQLLGVVTLMIYRFWARTALRRFFWRKIHIDGDPLEYSGRGSELFIGFLIVMAVLVPLLGGFAIAEQLIAPGSATYAVEKFVYVVVIATLVAMAQFRARRYRLSRTVWRGIRFAQTGSQWAYVRLTFGWGLLTIVTLGLAMPWLRWHQTRYLMSNTYFGDRPFEFRGSPLRLLGPWLVVPIAAAVAVVAPVWATLADLAPAAPKFQPWSLGLVPLGLVVMALAFLHYRVCEFRAVVAATSLGAARFVSRARVGKLIGLLLLYGLLVGLLLSVFVLVSRHLMVGFSGQPGPLFIGAAVAVAFFIFAVFGVLWTWLFSFGALRHFCLTLTIENVDSLDTIRQSNIAGPNAGEGLADSFDVGD